MAARPFASIGDFLEHSESTEPACFVLDVRLPGRSGLDFLDDLMAQQVKIPTICISGYADVPMSVRAMKAGAARVPSQADTTPGPDRGDTARGTARGRRVLELFTNVNWAAPALDATIIPSQPVSHAQGMRGHGDAIPSARHQSRPDIPCEDHVFVFGTFRFLPRQQLLLRDGQPVKLGGRAMDILHLLLKSAGEPVGKRALEQFAWPDTFVHESNLKVHISSLRRALGETSPQPTYISTVAGRGYRFIPRVSIEPIAIASVPSDGAPLVHSLPPQRPPIGREREIDRVASMLTRSRLVTLVGPGGVGKTTVALAAAKRFEEEGVGSVVFVDLSRVASEEFVPASLAAALGSAPAATIVFRQSYRYFARRTALLLLDTCEHVPGSRRAHLRRSAREDWKCQDSSRRAGRYWGRSVRRWYGWRR